MNNNLKTTTMEQFVPEMTADFQEYLGLCDEALTLTSRENQVLSGGGRYEPFEFFQRRRDLLPRLDNALLRLRKWRSVWLEAPQAERTCCSEVKSFFQSAQGLMMRVLILDRENQQALLRRGLVPPRHLSYATAAAQPPNHIANVYKRHTRS